MENPMQDDTRLLDFSTGPKKGTFTCAMENYWYVYLFSIACSTKVIALKMGHNAA